MKSFFCELILGCAVLTGSGKPVDDLTYGSILFAYYQQDYQQALLETAVSESQNRRGDNTIRFELARGSFAFSDGMFDHAQAIFASVPEEELTQTDRTRLAFHLAREFMRRGDWQRMEEQLALISLGENWRGKRRYHAEIEYMRAEGLIFSGQLDNADAVIENIDSDHPLSAYAAFNLGVALRNAGRPTDAQTIFRDLSRRKPRDRESFDLSQRARLALAMLARELNEVADAQALLRELPGQGRYQNVALAAYGDVAMARGKYDLAARIWLTLKKDPSWTGATAAARLKFPLALERKASVDVALEYYREAEQGFADRLRYVREMTNNVEDTAWLRATLAVFSAPSQNRDDLEELMNAWQLKLGHTDWLEWLATEQVHEVLTQWRELEEQRVWLSTLPERLAILGEIALEQQHRRQRVNGALENQALLQRRNGLNAQITDLGKRISLIRQNRPAMEMAWMASLADPDQLQVLGDLATMAHVFGRENSDADRPRLLRRIDRLRGLMFWQLNDQRSSRLRSFEKSLAELTVLSGTIDLQISHLAAAQDKFTTGVQTDFHGFIERADAMTVDIAQAQQQRETRLAAELKRGMEREVMQLERYLLATRIAIARSTDLLAMGRSQ